jgi:phosphopantetheinyl transferase
MLLYEGVLGITNIAYHSLLERMDDTLNIAEKNHFYSLPTARMRESYLRSQYISKITTSTYVGEDDLTRISIRHGVFFQPLLYGPNMISISHSGDFAVSLVFPDEHPMGVDLEIINPNAPDKIQSQLTAREIHMATDLNEEMYMSYTRFWTVKEALSKVLKTGLMVPLTLLEIEAVEKYKNYDLSYFRHFTQYKSITYSNKSFMISIVLPAETKLLVEKITIS